MVQHLEDALSHSITLKKDVKKPGNIPWEKAKEILEEHRSLTLGQTIKLSKNESIYAEPLLQALRDLLDERNWLVHKSMNREDMYSESGKIGLFNRIKDIGKRARSLQGSVEEDLMEFSSMQGMDMSKVHAAIKSFYGET